MSQYVYRVERCVGCRAPVIWTYTTNGKRMPVDAEPIAGLDRGFRLDEPATRHATPIASYTGDPDPCETLYVSHFAKCPDAARFRRTSR